MTFALVDIRTAKVLVVVDTIQEASRLYQDEDDNEFLVIRRIDP